MCLEQRHFYLFWAKLILYFHIMIVLSSWKCNKIRSCKFYFMEPTKPTCDVGDSGLSLRLEVLEALGILCATPPATVIV